MTTLDLKPVPRALLPAIWPRVHRHSGGAASAVFSDITGVDCIISESMLNHPVLVLGVHHRAMVLTMPLVRDIHRLTGRWLASGRLLSEGEHDYQI